MGIGFDDTESKTLDEVCKKTIKVNVTDKEKRIYTVGILSNLTETYLKSTIIWPT